MQITAREKLIEKHIDWHEEYTDKTAFLKKQFEDIIGEGSYYRFEGESSEGDRYYCIIGPAQVHKPRAKFFAGVRKLPATYSAGGKYFDSMDRAASYAEETWGVPTPKGLKPYTSAQLHGISAKVIKWKEEHGEDHEDDKDDKEETKESKKNNTLSIKRESSMSNIRRVYNLLKIAMPGIQQIRRSPMMAWSLQDILAGNVPEWATIAQNPTYKRALFKIIRKTEVIRRKIAARYGVSSEEADKFLFTFIGHDPSEGLYAYSIGPYFTEDQKIFHFKRWAEENGFGGITEEAIKVGLLVSNRIFQKDEETKVVTYDTSVKDKKDVMRRRFKVEPFSVANYARYVEKDMKNKFIFTKQRYQEKSAEELENAAKRYLISNMPQFLGILDQGDLRFMVTGTKPTSDVLPTALTTFTKEEARAEVTMNVEDEDEGEQEGGDTDQTPEWYRDFDFNDPRVKAQKQVAGDGVIIKINSRGIKKILETILMCTPSESRKQLLEFMLLNGIVDQAHTDWASITDKKTKERAVKEKAKQLLPLLYNKIMETENIPDEFSTLRDMRNEEKQYKKEYEEHEKRGGQPGIIRGGLKKMLIDIFTIIAMGETTIEDLAAKEKTMSEGAKQIGDARAIEVRNEMVNMAMTEISSKSGYVKDKKDRAGRPAAQKAGAKSFEEVKELYDNGDPDTVDRLYKRVCAIQAKMKKNPELYPQVVFMTPIAKMDALNRLKTPIGAQRYETLRIPPVVYKHCKFKATFLRVMNNLQKKNPANPGIERNPDAIAEELNRYLKGRTKDEGEEFSSTLDVPYWLNIIDEDMRAAEASGQHKTIAQLMDETEEMAENIKRESKDPEGFPTLHECVRVSNQSLQGGSEERIAGPELGLFSYNVDPRIIVLPPGTPNMEHTTLSMWRDAVAAKNQVAQEIPTDDKANKDLVKQDDKGVAEDIKNKAIPVDEVPEPDEQVPEPMEEGAAVPEPDILDDTINETEQPAGEGQEVGAKPGDVDFTVTDVEPKARPVVHPQQRIKEEEPLEDETEEDKRKASSKNREILSKTLNNLIKIAKELDNEGKRDESEEVSKVIRKYIGQIGKE